MPIVPRIAPAPLPGPQLSGNVSDAAFGGGAGNVTTGLNQGVSALHSEAAQIAQQERQKALEIGLTANRADLSAARNDVLFGPDGALTKQGKDAFDAPETFHANYYARVGQIRAGIKDDDQRDRFDQMVAADYSQADEQVQSHVAAQRQQYDTSSTNAAVENSQSLALKSYDQPNIVEPLIKTIRDATAAYGARNGWSDDETTELANKRVSDTRVGIVSRMLDSGDDLTASSYYAAHKDDIAGPDQGKVERALGLGSTQGEALRQVNALLAPKPDGTTATATDVFTQVEAIENPKVRKVAIELATAHFNELNSAQHIDRENARARVLTAVESNGGRLNEASSDWQLISGYPEGEQVLERQRQILHPAPDPGDPDKLVGYMAMAATNPETRQQLLATPISTIANDPTMNAAQKDRVITLIRGERMKDVSDLRTTHVAAAAAVKAAERDVKQATDDGDDDAIQSSTQRLYDAQQRETVLRGQLTRADRIAHTGPSAASAPTAAPAARSQPGQPATAPAATPPADARTSANPIGLLPAKPITPEMRRDLLAYGDGYANYLRTLGYDVSRGPDIGQRTAAITGGRPTIIASPSPYNPKSPGEYIAPTLRTKGDTLYLGTDKNSPADFVASHEWAHRLFSVNEPGLPDEARPDGNRDPALANIIAGIQKRGDASPSESFAQAFSEAMRGLFGSAPFGADSSAAHRANPKDVVALRKWIQSKAKD